MDRLREKLGSLGHIEEELKVHELTEEALRDQNKVIERECRDLQADVVRMAGHQNGKQKIHYLQKVKQDNLALKQDNARLEKEVARVKQQLAKAGVVADTPASKRRQSLATNGKPGKGGAVGDKENGLATPKVARSRTSTAAGGASDRGYASRKPLSAVRA